jgi:pimeloyl-ACP methyl ester carboxylesterase
MFLEIEKPERLRIDYSILGQGPDMVFIHGGASNHYEYKKLLSELSKYYKVYAFTMPGFAKSEKLRNYSLEKYFEALEEVINKLNLDSFILAGHSFGAGKASWYAYKHPEKVRKLILISPLLSPLAKNPLRIWNDIRKSIKQGHRLAKTKPKKTFVKRIIPFDLQNLPYILKVLSGANEIDLRDRLKDIKIPTLAFVSDNDLVIPHSKQMKDLEFIPHVKIIIQHSGHSHKSDIEKIVVDIAQFDNSSEQE